jgi:hypothetical protein
MEARLNRCVHNWPMASTDPRELPGEAESWHQLHELIDRLTTETAGIPGYFEEGWTAKDAVAHLGTWMARGAMVLRQIAAGTYREGELDIDAENERFLAAMRDVPLETVHLQAASARGELLSAWASLPEITEAARYWVRKSGPDHMAEHLPRLAEWVESVSR